MVSRRDQLSEFQQDGRDSEVCSLDLAFSLWVFIPKCGQSYHRGWLLNVTPAHSLLPSNSPPLNPSMCEGQEGSEEGRDYLGTRGSHPTYSFPEIGLGRQHPVQEPTQVQGKSGE